MGASNFTEPDSTINARSALSPLFQMNVPIKKREIQNKKNKKEQKFSLCK